jgi:hypothetical protein
MNDRAFDKHFREGLSGEIEHPFDDKLWDSLSQRLDEHDKGTGVLGGAMSSEAGSGFRHLYWLAPLFLLLLGTNAWYMWNAQKTQQDNEKLMGEMRSLKTILEKRDTVVKTQIIYKTDTIYIDRKILDIEKKISKTDKQNLSDAERGPSVPKEIGISQSSIFSTKKSIKIPFEPIANKISKASAETENPKTDLSDLSQKPTQSIGNQLVRGLVKKEESTNEIVENNIIPLEKKEEVKTEIGYKSVATQTSATDKLPLLMPSMMLLPTTPKQNVLAALNAMPIQKPVPFKRLYFGLTGSWLNYQTAWLNNANIEVHKTEQSYQVGLRMEYAFNDHFRLMLGSDYCPFDFNISWKDDRYNLPDVPTEYLRTHKMKSVEAREPLLNGFLGAKYIFNGIRARPYLGVAYSAMKILPYEATYHMQNLWTQADTDVAVPYSGATISNLMMLTGGYEFKIGGRFVAQTEAFFYKDLNKEQKMFDLFGVRATVLARF